MNRQEKRGLGDLRAMKRHQRVSEIVAAKTKSKFKKQDVDANALVIGVGPGVCFVLVDGAERLCRTDMPVVPGDRVAIRHEKVAGVTERRTVLARSDPSHPHRELVIAANIDTLAIVASIADPPFRPGLVDRYLIAASRGGLQPILCLTKIDLEAETEVADVYRQAGVPVVLCSVATGQGIEELRGLLAGSLVVFAGHSGVGKSSLLNTLADENRAHTGAVAEGTGKGRHTTTSSHLYQLKNGARVIDTPGIRSLGLGPVSAEEIVAAFPEFSSYPCRFRDCRHAQQESGCGVMAAVDSGGVARSRYESYLRLISV